MTTYAPGGYITNLPTITAREPRHPSVSFICHLANGHSYFAHHRSCDGLSYTASITDKGVPCTCNCHATGWDKA